MTKSVGMRRVLSMLCMLFVFAIGCEEKTTRKVTVEGPETKHEVKIETKESHK